MFGGACDLKSGFKVDPMARVEILDGVERRRRWPDAEKRRILEATLAPGVSVAEVARANGVAKSLVFGWRRQARQAALDAASKPAPMFLPVEIAEAADHAARTTRGDATERGRLPRGTNGLIEIELRDGRRVRVDAGVDAEALGRVLDALARR